MTYMVRGVEHGKVLPAGAGTVDLATVRHEVEGLYPEGGAWIEEPHMISGEDNRQAWYGVFTPVGFQPYAPEFVKI